MLKKHPDEREDHGLGRSRGGFGTKIHLATDGTGLPLSGLLGQPLGIEVLPGRIIIRAEQGTMLA